MENQEQNNNDNMISLSLSLEEINEMRLMAIKQNQQQYKHPLMPDGSHNDTPPILSLPNDYDPTSHTAVDDGMIFDEVNIDGENNSVDIMELMTKKRYELYLQSRTENFKRLDINATLFSKMSTEWKKIDFLNALSNNATIQSIHLSGYQLHKVLSEQQIENDLLINGICNMPKLYELFIFKGNCIILNEELLSKCISRITTLKVLMIWNFYNLCHVPQLAAAIRMHPNLQRVTFHIPCNLSTKYINWGTFDLYVMAMASMTNLKTLQIRCGDSNSNSKIRQKESIISQDGITILMNSNSIETLYLENCGLLDDHVDAIRDEVTLVNNTTLKSLYMSNNNFTDDVLYTFGQMLVNNKTLESLDLSGCLVSDGGGMALRNGIVGKNTSLLHLDIENPNDVDDLDEFEQYLNTGKNDAPMIKERIYDKGYMKDIRYQLRINRAYKHVGGIDHVHYSMKHWLNAIEQVSDHIDCSYHIIRTHSHHFQLWLLSLSPNAISVSATESENNGSE